MSLLRNIAVVLLLASVSACGFKPVYKDYGADKTLSASLAAIEVAPLRQDRHEQVLHSALQDLFHPSGSADIPTKYVLEVALERRRDASAIQRNREITRYNLSVVAKYLLKDKATGKVVKKGTSRMSGSYDIAASEFSNYTAEGDTISKIMREIAKDIRFQLTTGFLDKPLVDKKK
jgi:LPS-assembly lipoprotein